LNKLKEWVKNQCLPRIVFIPYFIFKIIPVPFGYIKKNKVDKKDTILCVEAGVKGWESIEFKELYQSACEYIGKDSVHKVMIQSDDCYTSQLKTAIRELQPTHYLYDPRTGNQKWYIGMWQSYKVAWLLHIYGVVPVVLLTDLAFRTWRAQSAIVTAKYGIVISCIAPRKVSSIFPHSRLVGPSLMPLSVNTMSYLDALFEKRPTHFRPLKTAVFTGSLYEPRTTILKKIAAELDNYGCSLDFKGRKMGGARMSDDEYWKILSHSPIIITTADQLESKDSDWTWIMHLLYRYLEVLAAGALLIAPEVPGIRRYFIPGQHFIPFTSAADAAKKIDFYLSHHNEREMIAKQGREQAKALVAARTFWMNVDSGLGKNSLT